MTNKQIRKTIYNYLKTNGGMTVSDANSMFSEEVGCSKNTISGNISCMVCIEGLAQIKNDELLAV